MDRMSRRRKPPKRERGILARLGGSEVARRAFDRPGGTHGRRSTPRSTARSRAIQSSKEES